MVLCDQLCSLSVPFSRSFPVVAGCHCILLPTTILLCGFSTVCFSICQLMATHMVSTLGLWRAWGVATTSSRMSAPFLSGVPRGAALPARIATLCSPLRNTHVFVGMCVFIWVGRFFVFSVSASVQYRVHSFCFVTLSFEPWPV